MNFQPHLATAVVERRKTVTRRAVSGNPRSPWSQERAPGLVGKSLAVCPGRGKNAIARVKVTSVERMALGILTDAEARLEGFANEEAFCTAWIAINGGYNRNALVWRVQFELERDDADGSQGQGQPQGGMD